MVLQELEVEVREAEEIWRVINEHLESQYGIKIQPRNRFPSCKHLELRPREEDLKRIGSYVKKFQKGELSNDEFREMLEFLRGDYFEAGEGRAYEPYCRKRGECCVLLESPVISMKEYGGLFQPIRFNRLEDRMKECEYREVPSEPRCLGGSRRENINSYLVYTVIVPLI